METALAQREERFQRRSLRVASVGFAILLLLGAAAAPARAAAPEAANPIATAIQTARLAEPLIRTAPTNPAEDDALALAITAFQGRGVPDDFSSLTGFLAKYPHSGWAPALLTNLGLQYLHYGYFSRALDAWQQAWEQGKGATDPRVRALIDGAVGNLVRLHAELGHETEVAALLGEIGKRPISGSATEAVQAGAEELALSRQPDHGHLFICGPLALHSLMVALGANPQQVDFLEWYRAGPNGTTLAELGRLADQAKFAYRFVFRKPGQSVPVPSIVHWKTGHFAAIVGEANGRYNVKDPVFAGQQLWVTKTALDEEASGYFLVPAHIAQGTGWRSVAASEAAGVWGKGPTAGTPQGAAGPQDPPADGAGPGGPPNGAPPAGPGAGGPGAGGPEGGGPPGAGGPPPCGGGMCGYNIGESTVSLSLSDTPVGYKPPIGPSAKVTIAYNQREDSQPQIFNFFNVSPKWTLNWLSYVTDDPNNPGANVARYLAGGGAYFYSGYQSNTGRFAVQNNDGSILVLASQSPITYQRQLYDGSIEIYAQSDGSTSYPRNIFLSKVIDPQGNALTLNYDSQMRLTSLTDAIGRQTTFTYGLPSYPLLVTQITDPFGRSATLTYDGSQRLSSITDVLGLTSSFSYDANSLVDAMTTPYGTTSFAYTAPGTSGPPRFLQATDPLGYNEREEWVEPAPNIPDSDPSNTVPQGMATENLYLEYRDSFHWDKNAYVVAGCTPSGGCDYTKARDRHFNHDASDTGLKSTSIESVKYPLENRLWLNYPGQSNPIYSGVYERPSAVGRVLDDGTTQLSQYSYDITGYYKLTQTVDRVGRTTSYSYPNHIDLSAITQATANGNQTTIAQFIYNYQHRPIYYTDAAGQTTTYSYNAAGQLTSVTNPLNQTTTYQYDPSGNLTTIINANNQTAASFTYDSDDRVRTYTDSEGWTVTFDYDAADRITRITYPDGTTDRYTYDKLDLAAYQDRLYRTWTYTHDVDRRLTKITDPLDQETQFGYDNDGRLTSLTDPKNNTTHWTYDVEGRVISKTYPDTSALAFTYENTTSRLHSVLDALGQTKQYGYTEDNRLSGITYLNAINPTPNVAFAYDPYFPRLLSMTDGTGTTTYAYVPVGSLGALRLAQEQSPLASSAIGYGYDALGRLVSRNVAGAGPESFGYDAIGRLTSHNSDLGAFTLSYLGQTGQIASRTLGGSTLVTNWGYLPNSGDRRLASIDNSGLASGQYSNFSFTSMPETLISGTTETSDASTVYPTTGTQTATYNNLNQLTNLSGQALTWDADGNLLSDGIRNYAWDAENRLVTITYPGQPDKETSFAYDGLSRRTAITSIAGVTTSYVWCGARICQARNSSGATTREYNSEGEYVPGAPGQPYYYGPDQVGTVRRVFASTTNAPAYAYGPYGLPLQATAPVTDFNYAGMFYNADSGLYLTQYRAYDPAASRWLSRDLIGESGDTAANLYRYVQNNPVSFADFAGLDYEATPAASSPMTFTWPSPPDNPAANPADNTPSPQGGEPSSSCPPASGNPSPTPSPAAGNPTSAGGNPSASGGTTPSPTAPPLILAGGITSVYVDIAHGGRHVDDPLAAGEEILENLPEFGDIGGSFTGLTPNYEYRAYVRPLGILNIGTFYPR